MKCALSHKLLSDTVQQVFDQFEKHKIDARFVGGCVRDSLLDKDFSDIDIAFHGDVENVFSIFENSGFKTIKTGLKHGTFTIVTNGIHIELTALRGEHNTVPDPWLCDANCRDLTINAIYADRNGHIFDPVSGYKNGILKKRVVFTQSAEERIDEDPLRILRFYRFSLIWGIFDEATHKICLNKSYLLNTVAPERLVSELKKILNLKNWHKAIMKMAEGNILSDASRGLFHNSLKNLHLLERYKLTTVQDRFAALCPENCNNLENMLKNLNMSSRDIAYIKSVSSYTTPVAIPYEDARKCSLIVDDKYWEKALLMAYWRKSISSFLAFTSLSVRNSAPHPEFSVSGKDMIALGHKPGPEMGVTIRKARKDWANSYFRKLPVQ